MVERKNKETHLNAANDARRRRQREKGAQRFELRRDFATLEQVGDDVDAARVENAHGVAIVVGGEKCNRIERFA